MKKIKKDNEVVVTRFYDIVEFLLYRGRFKDGNKRFMILQNTKTKSIVITVSKCPMERVNQIHYKDGGVYDHIFSADCNTPIETRKLFYQKLKPYKVGVNREHRYNISMPELAKIIQECGFKRQFCWVSGYMKEHLQW